MKIIITFFITFIFFVSLGAAMTNGNISEKPIIIEYGTEEFNDFVKSANITPQQAYEEIIIAIEKNPEGIYAKLLYVCVNNEYHFTTHANKVNYITLSGFYVDATTGNVRFVQQNERYKLKNINHSTYFSPKK